MGSAVAGLGVGWAVRSVAVTAVDWEVVGLVVDWGLEPGVMGSAGAGLGVGWTVGSVAVTAVDCEVDAAAAAEGWGEEGSSVMERKVCSVADWVASRVVTLLMAVVTLVVKAAAVCSLPPKW